jgi:hypothetical protein
MARLFPLLPVLITLLLFERVNIDLAFGLYL